MDPTGIRMGRGTTLCTAFGGTTVKKPTTILVLEDDPGIVRTLRRVLERVAIVTIVDNYEDGITMLKVLDYDLIICDNTLATEKTGRDVFAWIKTNRPDLVNAFVSHSSDDEVNQLYSRSVDKLNVSGLRALAGMKA